MRRKNVSKIVQNVQSKAQLRHNVIDGADEKTVNNIYPMYLYSILQYKSILKIRDIIREIR